MKTLPVILAFAAVVAFGAAPEANAERQAASTTPTDAQSRQNGGHFVQVCFNGLQGGKVIVRDGTVADDELETTAKACRIDGGDEAKVPRSPIIPAGSAAIS